MRYSTPASHIRRLLVTGVLAGLACHGRVEAGMFFTQGSATATLDALKKANVDGTGVTTIADNSDDFSQPKGIAVDSSNGYVYVADALVNGGGIIRYNLDGSGRTVVIAATAGAIYNDVAVAGSKIYFVQGSSTTSLDALKSANLDGSGVTTLASDSGNFAQPGGVAVDAAAGFIYVADSLASGGGIIRYSLTGTGRTVVVTPTASAQYNDVTVAGSKIYFTQGSATATLDALKSANLDGSSVTTLASGSTNFIQPGGLAVDATAGFIYLADASASGLGIIRYTLAGGSRTVLVSPTASSLYNDVSLEGGDVAPNAPSSPDLTAASDSGSSNTDNITNDNTPTFTGTAEAGSTVTILRNGSSVGSGVATGGNYSITTSSLATGTASITATATNLAGTSAASSALSITIDTTTPTISIGSPSASATKSGPVTYTVTYSDSNFSSSTLANGNITLNSTGTATGSLAVTGSGTARTVTLSSITGDGTLGISIASDTASDTAGNLAPAAGPSTTFTVDNTAPAISIGAPSASLTKTGPVSYTVTYSGENSISLVTGNVTVNTTGGAAVGLVDVTGTGSTRTVTLSNITGDGTVGISLAAATALDAAGNSAAAAGPSTTFAVDNTAPAISISAPSAASVSSISGTASYTITYTDANFSASTLATGNITLNSTGTATGSLAVTGSGTARTVTISSITGSGTLGISIAAGTASDTAGNNAPAAGPSTTFAVQKAAATVTLGSLAQTYDGSAHAATATTSPAGLTVNFTYNGSSTAPTNAGSYAVVGTISDTNYQGSASDTLEISKVSLNVTADDATRPYDTADPVFAATITGFVNSETTSVVSGTPTLTTTATATSVPGVYPINTAVGTLAATNYSFTPLNGTLTVTPQVIGEWAEKFFTPTELEEPTISGPDADPDSDGLSNAMEYALGTSPLESTLGALPVLDTVEDGGSTYLRLTITRNPYLGDLTPVVEISGSLATPWSVAGVVTLTNTPTLLVVRDNIPLATQARFIRWNVSAGSATPAMGGHFTAVRPGTLPSPVNTPTGHPFARPAVWRSKTDGVSGVTVTVSDSPWTAGEFTATPHYLTALEGPLVGMNFDILSNTTDTLTLAGSSALIAGQRFEIRSHATIGNIFGTTNPSAFAGGATIADADELQIFDNVAQTNFRYYSLGNTAWRSSASSSIDESGRIVDPEQGFVIVNKSGGSRTFVAIGEARIQPQASVIVPGLNWLTVTQPLSVTLDQFNIRTGNNTTGLASATTIAAADELQRWNGTGWDRYYYKSGGLGGTGWRSSASTSVDRGGALLKTGDIVIIQRKISPGFIYFRPAAP